MAPSALEKANARIEHLTDRCAELDADLQRAHGNVDTLREDRDHWRDARLPDLEAEALAGCVRAIEAMRQAPMNESSSGGFSVGGARVGRQQHLPVWHSIANDGTPSAKGDPVGRILLSLAARYGLAIDCVEPPEQAVGLTPEELAGRIDDFVRDVIGGAR